MTKEIIAICRQYGIIDFRINADHTVDVNGNVNFNGFDFPELPLQFGKVTGKFECMKCGLKTLKGSPHTVGGSFYCSYNKIESLEGGPKHLRGSFYCTNNYLETLDFGPRKVGRRYDCRWNTRLRSLRGAPVSVGKEFMYAGSEVLTPYETRYALLTVTYRIFGGNNQVERILTSGRVNDVMPSELIPGKIIELKEMQ